MEIWTLLLVLVTCYGAQAAADSDNAAPVVSTASGEMRGTVQHIKNLTDKPVFTFLGIPYAAPPVGDLRFRAPQPVAKWEGIRDATRLGPYCPQDPSFLSEIVPSPLPHYNFDEDCLSLNIETPTMARDAELTVLLWIHGGALTIGAGYLLTFAAMVAHQDVVLVTINYRLGALGFLSTEDENAPGNFGLLDQLDAMKWVKENIRNFGGDPGRVTIFGESAGGVSVHYHVLSPLSKGLFRRAISQSGTWKMMGIKPKPRNFAALLAEQVGCDTEDTAGMVACLRQKTADEILNGTQGIPNDGFTVPFLPVVDGKFILVHPDDLYDNGQTNAVEYLLGMNSHESGWLLMSHIPNFGQGMTRDMFLHHVNTLVEFFYQDSNKDKIVAAIREMYRDHGNPDYPMAIQYQATLFYGDFKFVAPTVDAANKHAATGSKVYLYEYHHAPSFLSDIRPGWVGCDHNDDVFITPGFPFLDVPSKFGGRIPWSEDDKKVSRDMMAFWANFARTGSPSDPTGGPADNPAVPVWPQYTPDNPAYMKLDVTSSADVGLHPERVALWNDVIPNLVAVSKRDEL